PDAQAACSITGAGSVQAPQTGATVVCNDVELDDPIVTLSDANNVTITFGDGLGEVDGNGDIIPDTIGRALVVSGEDSQITINADASISSYAGPTVSIIGARNTVTINGGLVSAEGGRVVSLFVAFDNHVTLSGGEISATGNGTHGMEVFSGSGNTVEVSGGEVSTAGDDADGIFSNGESNTITV
ncbi:hypothetical protein PDO_5363, partial [Rhizobium sp. PDO1-076]|uniref:hypothetical protein n=1 Tax=Rhizobium sp. PDO1-076 TaxID=1125979 RepID=UPI00024E2409